MQKICFYHEINICQTLPQLISTAAPNAKSSLFLSISATRTTLMSQSCVSLREQVKCLVQLLYCCMQGCKCPKSKNSYLQNPVLFVFFVIMGQHLSVQKLLELRSDKRERQSQYSRIYQNEIPEFFFLFMKSIINPTSSLSLLFLFIHHDKMFFPIDTA